MLTGTIINIMVFGSFEFLDYQSDAFSLSLLQGSASAVLYSIQASSGDESLYLTNIDTISGFT